MATYPSLLADFTDEGTFDPFELFAGEADIISDNGVVGAVAIEQFRVIARDASGLIVKWDETAGVASKAGTFSAVGTAADTITVNGVVFTLTASPAAITDVLIGGTATATALNFANAVNADVDATQVLAVPAAAVVTLYALQPGTPGNSIAIAESSTSFSFAGGATALSGGGPAGEASRAIGIAAQAGAVGGPIPFYTGGGFNSDALVWPAAVTTLAQRKAAFDRTNIEVAQVKGVSTNIAYP